MGGDFTNPATDDATVRSRENSPERRLTALILYHLGPNSLSLKPRKMSVEDMRDFVLGIRLSA
jgi:hypothetical protein